MQATHTITRRIAKGFRVLGYSLLGLLLGLALLLGLGLGTQAGRVFLLQTAIDTLHSRSDFKLQLQQLRSPRLGLWQFSAWQLTQHQRLLAKAQQLQLSWQPSKLLRGQIVVDKLKIEGLQIDPAIWQTPQTPSATTSSETEAFVLADFLGKPLPQVQIKELELPALQINKMLIGTSTVPLPPMNIIGSVQMLNGRSKAIAVQASSLNSPSFAAELALSLASSKTIRVEAALREADGEGYLRQLLHLPPSQSIQLQLAAHLSADKRGYQLSLEHLKAPIAQHQISASGKLATALDFSEGSISEFIFWVDEQRQRASAQWDRQRIQASAKIQQLPLAISAPWQQQLEGGHVTANLELQGSPQAPQLQGELELASRYQNRNLQLQLSGSANSQSANIQQLHASWGESQIRASGTAAWQTAQSDLKAHIENVNFADLSDFGVKLPEQLQMRAQRVDAQLSGNIQDLEGQLSAEISGRYAEQAFALSGELEKHGDVLDIQRGVLSVGKGNLSVAGTLNIASLQAQLALQASALPLTLLSSAGLALPDNLQGEARAEGSISGDLRQANIQLTATLDGNYDSLPFSLNLDGSFEEQQLLLEQLALQAFDKPVLHMSGRVDKSNMAMQLSANRLPTELLEAFGWPVEPGRFSADLKAEGPLMTPDIGGKLSYHRGGNSAATDPGQQAIHFGWNVALNTENQHYQVSAQIITSDLPSGHIQIRIPQHVYREYFEQQPPGPVSALPLHAAIEAQLNLFALESFINPELHRLSGVFQTQLELRGSAAQPDINGELRLANARYRNRSQGTRLEDIQCAIQVRRNLFSLEACEANDDGEGYLQLAGQVRLPDAYLMFGQATTAGIEQTAADAPNATVGFSDDSDDSSRIAQRGEIALKVSAEQLKFPLEPIIESEASGELQLQGDFTSLLASGEIKVAPLSAAIDTVASSGIPKIKVTRVERLEEVKNRETKSNGLRSLPSINLNLVVSAGQQAYIRGHGLEAELSGKIVLRGTVESPRYDGEFSTLRGTFEVFGKKFTLEQGQVNFSNNAIALNITGVYNKQDQRIRATLTGTGDNPELSLSAEPSMPEDEILAFIIFGKSVQEITPFEALQLAASAQTLRGGGSFFDPIGSARDLLGVDTLSIATETDDEGEVNVNVGVGKYLNDKVYLQLERSPNPSQPWKGQLQIELSPNIHLESVTGETTGIDGAEIKWKKDY